MVKFAALFPGQGAQYPNMGLDLYAASQAVKELWEKASAISGKDVKTILTEGDEALLMQTQISQVVISVVSRSVLTRMKELGFEPSVCAGFSLGELPAYAAAGIISDETLFSLITERGRIMGEISATAEQRFGSLGMAAVIGMGFEAVTEVLLQENITDLFCANDNGPSQVVVSGSSRSLENVTSVLKKAGAKRIIPLKVSGPFHTPLMAEAAQEFSQHLAAYPFQAPEIPVFANATGALVKTAEEARKLCEIQLTKPVRWTSIMNNLTALLEAGDIEACYETGPGKVLSGLWRSIGSPVSCLPLGSEDQIKEHLL